MKYKLLKSIPLYGTKKGQILISDLKEPYDEGSNSVISIGITLKDENTPDWKIHIPYENLDEVIEALGEIKKEN